VILAFLDLIFFIFQIYLQLAAKFNVSVIKKVSASAEYRQPDPRRGFAPELHLGTSVPKLPNLAYHFKNVPPSLQGQYASTCQISCRSVKPLPT